MERSAQLNFIQQQGFRKATASACEFQYPALMFQPRLIGVLVVSGLVFQSWPLFLILSAVLWRNVLRPASICPIKRKRHVGRRIVAADGVRISGDQTSGLEPVLPNICSSPRPRVSSPLK